MPEREFELYLSLLSRFLRLKPSQHDEIADELRDHLEQRLEELAARGMAHDEAIRTALGEFGDAAELANHFTRERQVRRRKLIVRRTLGTVAALAASLLIATAFWPTTPHAPLPARGVAQDGKRAAKVDRVVARFPGVTEAHSRTEAKLKKTIEKLTFDDLTIETAIEKLGAAIDVDFMFATAELTDAGISIETPVQNLAIKHTKLEARTLLGLLLEPLQLGYFIRDGLVTITTAAKIGDRFSLHVYNVRDLMTAASLAEKPPEVALENRNGKIVPAGAQGTGGSGMGMFDVPVTILKQGFGGGAGEPAAGSNPLPTSGFGGGSTEFGVRRAPGLTIKPSAIADLITSTVDPEMWDDVGGPCSIVEYWQYGGLLFVRASDDVHRKIESFLDEMQNAIRDAIAAKEAATTTAPGH